MNIGNKAKIKSVRMFNAIKLSGCKRSAECRLTSVGIAQYQKLSRREALRDHIFVPICPDVLAFKYEGL
jgi:hypothetical protein